jgi:hypothetical protein
MQIVTGILFIFVGVISFSLCKIAKRKMPTGLSYMERVEPPNGRRGERNEKFLCRNGIEVPGNRRGEVNAYSTTKEVKCVLFSKSAKVPRVFIVPRKCIPGYPPNVKRIYFLGE